MSKQVKMASTSWPRPSFKRLHRRNWRASKTRRSLQLRAQAPMLWLHKLDERLIVIMLHFIPQKIGELLEAHALASCPPEMLASRPNKRNQRRSSSTCSRSAPATPADAFGT